MKKYIRVIGLCLTGVPLCGYSALIGSTVDIFSNAGDLAAYEPKEMQLTSGLKKKKSKIDFNFNVIQFVQANGEPNSRSLENFNKLTGMCKGEYQTVAGLEEIQNYASTE